MRRRLVLLALAACFAAACAKKEPASEEKPEKTSEPEKSAGADPLGPGAEVTHGGAQHADPHAPDPAVPLPPGTDPYYFKDDEPMRAALQPKFKGCYQKGLNAAGTKNVSGRHQFLLQIAPTGKPLQLTPTATTGLSDPIVKCLETTALAGKFAVTTLPVARWIKFDLNFQ